MNQLNWIEPFSFIVSLIAGIAFGCLLKKARLNRFDTIVGQFIFKDFTLIKVVLSAIIITSLGLYIQGYLQIKPETLISTLSIERVAIGGLIFGLGLVVLGYCPGTLIASIAEGAKDGISGLLGLITGSIFFNSYLVDFMVHFDKKNNIEKLTIHDFFQIPELLAIIAFLVLLIAIRFYQSRKK